MAELAEYVEGYPNISGNEEVVKRAIENRETLVFLPNSPVDFNRINSAFSIALHMHQPLIPADSVDQAELICNLQDMMDKAEVGDNAKAHLFHQCYRRPGELIPELYDQGYQPRMMLDYSGILLHGLRSMGLDDVIESLQGITRHPRYRECIEWLGAPWGHAVAPSTPAQDFRLHVNAFQQHFAAIFGLDALSRIRGFSPAEMALPNHPESAYAFVKTLKDAGYEWVLLQEKTVEMLNGKRLENPHLPHRLICQNSAGDSASIVAIIKTKRSEGRLIGHMVNQPEAEKLSPIDIDGRGIPPLVTQIADGENGESMMTEFPDRFRQAVRKATGSTTPMMNISEYLDNLEARGYTEMHYPAIQPSGQAKIWQKVAPGCGNEMLEKAITQLKQEAAGFDLNGGSWTNDISWVEGYENVLLPMDEASKHFAQKVRSKCDEVRTDDPRYREVLFHLLSAQTSCYRYWGQGRWTDYGIDMSRRTMALIDKYFP